MARRSVLDSRGAVQGEEEGERAPKSERMGERQEEPSGEESRGRVLRKKGLTAGLGRGGPECSCRTSCCALCVLILYLLLKRLGGGRVAFPGFWGGICYF